MIEEPPPNYLAITKPTEPIADVSNLSLTLGKLIDFLNSDANNLLEESSVGRFAQEATELYSQVKSLRSTIAIGLIGGTGVGKSTFINALAGKEISRTSDRRPYTSKAVVYRHEQTFDSPFTNEDLFKKPDAVHQIETLRDLIVLDLPDFDSHDQRNQQTVLNLLPDLDMIVWVVSPEKYADASFFEFVKKCKVHRENFSFVFNKSDQLMDETSSDKYTKLKEALGDFIFHLKTSAEVTEPRLYSLSAYEALTNSTSDQFLKDEFNRFTEFIKTKRTAKEVRSLKFLNLFVRSKDLFDRIYTESQPELKKRTIESIIDIKENQDFFEVAKADESTIAKISSAIFMRQLASENGLVPIMMAMKLLTFWSNVKEGQGSDRVFQEITNGYMQLKKPWEERLERVRAKLNSEAMLGAFHSMKEVGVSVSLDWNSNKPVQSVVDFLNDSHLRLKSFRTFFLKIFQGLILSVPIAMLFIKLVEDESLKNLIRNPDIFGFFWALAKLGSSLFGPEGLSAILSLILLELILMMWLANRRIKKLRKTSNRLALMVMNNLERKVEEQAKRVEESIDLIFKRTSSSLESLQSFKAFFNHQN